MAEATLNPQPTWFTRTRLITSGLLVVAAGIAAILSCYFDWRGFLRNNEPHGDSLVYYTVSKVVPSPGGAKAVLGAAIANENGAPSTAVRVVAEPGRLEMSCDFPCRLIDTLDGKSLFVIDSIPAGLTANLSLFTKADTVVEQEPVIVAVYSDFGAVKKDEGRSTRVNSVGEVIEILRNVESERARRKMPSEVKEHSSSVR